MKQFSPKFFKKIKISESEIKQLYKNSLRDLTIAKNDTYQEVRFTYAYQALIKAGIALIAHVGKVKIKSMPGHHVKLLEEVAEILSDNDVFILGNAMRMKRNTDLYGGGELISEKEAADYCVFVEGVIKRIAEKISTRA